MNVQLQRIQRTQQGFTLIELMIVIAILAILLAIAIPAYQDYSIRARVSEGINMAASAKMAVSEHVLSQGSFPTSNEEAGYETGVSTLVASIGIGTDGIITVIYSQDPRLGDAQGGQVIFTPDFSTSTSTAVQWDCAPGTTDAMSAKFLPAECRD